MTLRWMSGAEMYEAAAAYDLTQNVLHYSADTRGPWSARSFGTSFTQGYGQASLGVNASTLFVGGGWDYTLGSPPISVGSSQVGLICVWDGGTVQSSLQVESGGVLRAYRGSAFGTPLGSASTRVIQPRRWYFIEVKFVIDNSAGQVQVLVDGEEWLNVTSQDTQSTANAYANSVSHGGSNDWRWDDLYVCDSAGSAPFNTFLGDVGIARCDVTGAGDATQLNRGGSDSGANWSQVEEADANDDTDYVYENTVDDRDLYATANVPTELTDVQAATVYAKARKSNPGLGELAIGVKYDADDNGTADTESFDADHPLSTSYAWEKRILETQPDGDPWTDARWNAVQLGVKVR